MRKALAILTLALAAAGTFTACSTGNPEAQAMCTALDQGAPPIVAVGKNYQVQNETDAPAMVHRVAQDIRDTCPAHNDVADNLEYLLNFTQQYPPPPGYSSANGEVNPNPAAGG